MFDRWMSIMLRTPGPEGLAEVVQALREWQYEGAPIPLHVGDLGWFWRFGVKATAAAVRIWERDGRILAVGLLDGPEMLRLAIAPEARDDDDELARAMAEDVMRPDRGVLVPDKAFIEARWDGPFHALLRESGWELDEPWVPLIRSLSEPVPDCGLRIEVVGPEQIPARVAVQRASFKRSTFTAERWHQMAAGLPYAEARCLLGYDDQGTAVATTTVWSSGPGKPGLIEPLGVHHDHRGHGYGRAISVAAAATLREMGSSSVTVCTPRSNVPAVSAYQSAGMEALPDVRDLRRP